jgi:ADP-ribose pyrophosphatase
VCIEDVELPDGRSLELEMIRHPGASAIVPFEANGDVLLIRQFRHAVGGTIWEVPAGKLDGDTPEVCARRELEEEAGRRAGRLVSLGNILTTPGFTDEVIHLFAAYDLEEVPTRRERDEFIEVVRTPLPKALELVWKGELRDAKSAMALIHAARHEGVRVP